MSETNDTAYRPTAAEPVTRNPRRKLLRHGVRSLSNTELVTLVIGGDGKTARRILRRYGLARMGELSTGAWRRERGMGPASVARLVAVCELGRRTYGDKDRSERPRLNGPLDVHREVRDLKRLKKEHLIGLYLDAQNGLIHKETISIGSLNTTRTHPREILHPALVHLACGFILAHNHPSGSVDPSPEDVEFTRAVARAGELMGIELYDHLIVAREVFCSLRERGLL